MRTCLVLGCVLLLSSFVDPAGANKGKAIKTPSAAFDSGQPALVSQDTVKDWLSWKGAAVLGFFAPNQQGMGLKALASEYKGKLPLGGVRATDVKVQEAFGVKPQDLPAIAKYKEQRESSFANLRTFVAQ